MRWMKRDAFARVMFGSVSALLWIAGCSSGDDAEPRNQSSAGASGKETRSTSGGSGGAGTGGHKNSGGNGAAPTTGGTGGSAVGGSGGTTPNNSGGTAGGSTAPRVYNLVDADGVARLTAYLGGDGDDDLRPLSKKFYEKFGDDYDFVYFLADIEGTGRLIRIRQTEPLPSLGLATTFDSGDMYGSASRLKSIVGLALKNGNGPTIHETLHTWSMFLDPSFGFSKPHWGNASTDGSHGGFKRDTLLCEKTKAAPTGNPPACPLDGSSMKVSAASYSPGAASDAKPYAPIELYLMGLIPASEVKGTFLVMENAVYERSEAGRIFLNVSGFHEVTINDIVAKHGARPAATQKDFRGAFVLVTAGAATQTQLDKAERWARIFGGAQDDKTLLSFQKATRNLATMDTVLGAPK